MKAAVIKRMVLDAFLAVVWFVFLSTQTAAASLHQKISLVAHWRTPGAFAELHNVGKEKACTSLGARRIRGIGLLKAKISSFDWYRNVGRVNVM